MTPGICSIGNCDGQAKVCEQCHEEAIRSAVDEATAELRAAGSKMFPIASSYGYTGPAFPKSIPWSVAEKAYSVYVATGGRSQTLERLAERGGFHAQEMDEYHPTWREEAGEIAALRAKLAEAERECDEALAQGRREEREACCQRLCVRCAAGEPVTLTPMRFEDSPETAFVKVRHPNDQFCEASGLHRPLTDSQVLVVVRALENT